MNILDFIQNVSTLTFRPREKVFTQNEKSDGRMFFVFAGTATVYHENHGVQEAVNHLKPGDFFGEMALLSAAPRSATVVADDEILKLGVIDQRTFVQISKTQPSFLYQLLKVVMKRLVDTEQKVKDLQKELKAIRGK